MDEAIVCTLSAHNFVIGERTAEKVKINLGSAFSQKSLPAERRSEDATW